MRIGKTMRRVAGGAAVAAFAAFALPGGTVVAKQGRKGKSGALLMTDIDVGGFAGVAQNHIVDMKFSQPIDAKSVGPATVRVRAQNANGTGYTIDVPGTFQVAGAVVRFFPRLPTHLRDPATTDGSFYAAGTPQDSATANAGFQPSRNHRITIVGSPELSTVSSARGRRLNRSYTALFTTSGSTPASQAFSISEYTDSPPPGFQFSNPPDRVGSATDQYARHGGTQDVPSGSDVTLFGNKVPLSPATVRQTGNVTLAMVERFHDTGAARPISGRPSVEQNFDTVRLAFHPDTPLPDLGTFALRVTKNVRDLTETFDFANNRDRLRLRDIYEFLVAGRVLLPSAPPEQLADPPADLIFDWPADPVARGVLKRNVLALGDTHPEEVDPRVMVIFTTRDEPVSHAQLALNFFATDGYFDAPRSSGEWDQTMSGVANGVFTAAGGSGANGDLIPAANTVISSDQFLQNTVNWRKVNIPPNIVVTVTGTRPAYLKVLDCQIDGTLRADGSTGADSNANANYSVAVLTNSPTPLAGGAGGPGGGAGGVANNTVSPPGVAAGTGVVGNDAFGVPAPADAGGRGGLGGAINMKTIYSYSGGGGGGGGRLAGGAGSSGTYPTATWNGPGGAGGAGALGNATLGTFVGGAGGGGGGAGAQPSNGWGTAGGSGGGGGGAVILQTAATLRVGATGVIRARGGDGGKGSGVRTNWASGPGGGGGGGSILLRSARGFSFANPAASIDVAGGAGGVQAVAGGSAAVSGGSGGAGFIRIESPTGGLLVPGGSSGSYLPVGAGVPSFVYTRFVDLGVDQAKFLSPTKGDFSLEAGNDAIFVEVQAAIEDPARRGSPLLTSLTASENSTNLAQVSAWQPLRLVDNTPSGTAFAIPGNTATDTVFPMSPAMLGRNYKFVRFRISFQLDPSQTAVSALPSIDRMVFRYDFNF